jgi:hypothetical protein
LTVFCINGHSQEQDVASFGPAWAFKCHACGTIYCAGHVAHVEEVKQ